MLAALKNLSICLLLSCLIPAQPALAQLFMAPAEARNDRDCVQAAGTYVDTSKERADAPFSMRIENRSEESGGDSNSEPQKERATNTSTLQTFQWGLKFGEPRAIVIMMHGLLQHAECFGPIANHLAQRGYLAVALDQRGHGSRHFKNLKSDPGYNIDYPGSIEDLVSLARVLRAQHPTLPLFCLGESAGAAIAVRSATSSPGTFDGLVLCAFATKPRAVRVLWTAEDVVAKVFHWNHEIKMSRYIKKFSSEDDRIKLETMNDPMCRTGISLSELIDTCKFMKNTGKLARKLQPNLPLLMIEGQDDQVLDPKSSGKFLRHAHCENKDLVLIPHCGHVLVSTHYLKPLVVSSIDDWLDLHTPGQFATNAIVAGAK